MLRVNVAGDRNKINTYNKDLLITTYLYLNFVNIAFSQKLIL